jgi:hypothetical protein
MSWRAARSGPRSCAQNASAASSAPSPSRHSASSREIVEQRGGAVAAVEEQRQVVLDAGRRAAGLQVLVQRAAARCRCRSARAARCARADGVASSSGTRGRAASHRVDLLQRALGLRVEGADRVDGIVEQLDAVGLVRRPSGRRRAGRRARRSRPGPAPAARCGSRRLRAGASRRRGPAAARSARRSVPHEARRRQPLHQGLHRHHHDAARSDGSGSRVASRCETMSGAG